MEDPDSTPSAVLPAELDDAADQAVGAPASTKIETTKGRASALVRLVTHVSVVAPFAFAAIVLMRRGWFAEGDGAVITARSFEVFTAHSPLVGQLTWLRAPGIFDLGPLEYWLITLPVHLDPRNGALWGSALMCALAASLAVEACRAAAGAIGGVTAALVTVGTLCWMPSLAYSPMWNPHFGEMWFLAAIGCSFAVLCGRIGFLPLLVLAASVAMQSHLMFAAAGAALGVLGLAVGLVTIRRTGNGTRWWNASVAVGIACWAAPLAQELTASRGNLTLLLSGSHTHYRVAFGLQALSRASAPPWQWLGSISTHPDNLNALLTSAPVWPAAVVLVLSVAMFPLASLLKSRALMALATVNVVLVLNLVLYFGDIPSSVKTSLYYLITPFLITAVVAWLTVLTGLADCVRFVRRRHEATHRRLSIEVLRPVVLAASAALAMSGIVAVALVQQSDTIASVGFSNMKLMATACQGIEHELAVGPVRVGIDPATAHEVHSVWSADMQGLASCLRTGGYAPELPGRLAQPFGSQYEERPGVPIAVLESGNARSATVRIITDGHGSDRTWDVVRN